MMDAGLVLPAQYQARVHDKRRSAARDASVLKQRAKRRRDLRDGWYHLILERVSEGQRDAFGSHAPDGRVQQLEPLVGHDRGDRSTPAALIWVLLDDQ